MGEFPVAGIPRDLSERRVTKTIRKGNLRCFLIDRVLHTGEYGGETGEETS